MENLSNINTLDKYGSDDSEDCESENSEACGGEDPGTPPELAEAELDMAWELKNEEEVLQKVQSLQVIQENDQLVKMLKSTEKMTDKILLPSYEDITNMISNGAVFLVDGDSLLLHIMGNKNYYSRNGGQILHLIYLCERFLQLFYRKGGCFEIIFFNIWNQAWTYDPTVLLARSILIQHLKFNMSTVVHEFESVWDRNFEDLLQNRKFGFLLVDYLMTDLLEQLFHEEKCFQKLIFHVEMCYCLVGLSLGVVDMNSVKLNVSTLNAFYTPPRATIISKGLRKILVRVIHKLERISNEFCSVRKEHMCSIPDIKKEDIRHVITVQSAVMYLNDKTSPEPRKEWIAVFLLYSALLEHLPLDLRGFTNVDKNLLKGYYEFVEKMQQLMNYALQRESQNVNYNFQSVSDLWHGNLLAKVTDYLISQKPTDSIHLGEQIMSTYQELLCEVAKSSKVSLEKFHEIKNLRAFNKIVCQVSKKNKSKRNKKDACVLWPAQLIPTSCILTHEFCKDIMPDQLKNNYGKTLQSFIQRNSDFNEKHHWHSRKALTDEYEQIKDAAIRNKKENNKFSYHMSLYGASIEGRPLSSKPIINKTEKSVMCKKNKEIGKNPHRKEPKLSKAAIKIIEDKQRADERRNKESDTKILQEFKLKYQQYKLTGKYKLALDEIDLVLDRLKTEEMHINGLLKKVGILWHLWTQDHEMKTLEVIRDLSYAKDIFLVLRDLLRNSTNYQLEEKSSKLVGNYFRQLGFDKIAEKWGLPKSNHSEILFPVGISWVEFQLNELGPDLEREVGNVPDNRVEGFIPDNWQRELFDHIDKRHSVLVVAPTSSGKTYASYYCMEEVLREGNNGVVVYVAPTKALVNQVAATVYARFKNKNMPPGKSVYGVFTREYHINAMNCQILITVPQCLEILLLSPRRHDWVKSLRYVIFDEIHCLAGQAGGFSWESGLLMIQCPFLALSATIKDPSDLHMWFQSMQDFKKSQDMLNNCIQPAYTYEVKLVVYADRHADLRKHVYTEAGEFQHIHPYAYLDEIHFGSESVIPTAIALSPEEVNQLYKAMNSVSPKDPCLQELEPELYFSRHTDGFLSRKAVREYQGKLKELLENWACEDHAAFKSVVRQLEIQPDLSSISKSSEWGFIQRNFINFIRNLQHRNMLPAILFSYNRNLVSCLFEKATNHYERCIERHKEKWKFVERVETKVKMGKEPKDSKFRRNAHYQIDFEVSRGVHGKNKYEKTLGLLDTENVRHFYGITVKQVGYANESIVQHVESRLMRKTKPDNPLPRGLKMGIGIHHSGMNAVERSSVEMLFRMRVLNIVLATGTLALGIHMPCKTVAVIGDSRYLNPLEFQQMSGRAGRRGYDITGNVVFMGLNERKMRNLMLGGLPKMIGNIPLNVSMVLQLLLLVNNVTSQCIQTQEAKRSALSRALTMLSCCLAYKSFPELEGQMKHFFAFSTQFLMLQGLLDDAGKPQFLTGIVTHLRYHEPGNIAFVFLMKSGALRKLCTLTNGKISYETQLNLIIVLSYLFGPLILHKQAIKQKYNNSKVILPCLPSYIRKVLEEYNEQVLYIFHNYLKSVSANVEEDKTLPMSGIKIQPKEDFDLYNRDPNIQNLENCIVKECEPRKVCSSFAALSGHTDEEVYTHQDSSNIRHQVFTDMKFMPTVDLDEVLNGYAWDFYNHGIASAIRRDNGLKEGEDFSRLQDFMLVLKCIQTSLSDLKPLKEDDVFYRTFNRVADTFAEKFNKAYYQYQSS